MLVQFQHADLTVFVNVKQKGQAMVTQNARLKNLFKLSHKISIYCPSVDQNGQSVKVAQEIVDKTLALLSKECGGATSTKAVGCWVTGNGQLIKEDITLVFAFCENLTRELIDLAISHCEYIKSVTDQESIAIEIDGELYFV